MWTRRQGDMGFHCATSCQGRGRRRGEHSDRAGVEAAGVAAAAVTARRLLAVGVDGAQSQSRRDNKQALGVQGCALAASDTPSYVIHFFFPDFHWHARSTPAMATSLIALRHAVTASTRTMSLFHPRLLRASLTAAAATKPTQVRIPWHPYSTPTAGPNSVSARLQADLKTALRSKNKPALDVIRALQAEIINASKTEKPIETDGAFFSLVQRRIKASMLALKEFQAAGRDDLISREEEQLRVLSGYADQVPQVPDSELDALIKDSLEGPEAAGKGAGQVMGRVMGRLRGRPVDSERVMDRIQTMLQSPST